MSSIEIEAKWLVAGFTAASEFAGLRDFMLLYKYMLSNATRFDSSCDGPVLWVSAHVTPTWGLHTDPYAGKRTVFIDSFRR